jgi:hypothetical protein
LGRDWIGAYGFRAHVLRLVPLASGQEMSSSGEAIQLRIRGAILPKYAGQVVRQRGSSPKLQVRNTALMTAQSGLAPEEIRADGEYWGRLVESAVGAHLVNAAASDGIEVFYWRDRNREVDFVVKSGRSITAIEVKSGRRRVAFPGMSLFQQQFRTARVLLVGQDGVSLEDFLTKSAGHWIA